MPTRRRPPAGVNGSEQVAGSFGDALAFLQWTHDPPVGLLSEMIIHKQCTNSADLAARFHPAGRNRRERVTRSGMRRLQPYKNRPTGR
jgi:hypothetical protein